MTNRIPDHLSDPRQNGHRSQSVFEDLGDLAQKQFAHRMRQVEVYVQEHPVTGIGAALCIGICLGWIIKRR